MNLRNFDVWNRYTDDAGRPLHGCVEFFLRDGTTHAEIYDSDETPLSNPIVTNAFGRTDRQVFIDGDVIARFFKYTGASSWYDQTGIDTSDSTKWEQLYSIESQLDLSVDIHSDSAISIPDMSSLRSIDPEDVPEVDGKKLVWLCGYNESGDCAAVMYYWDPESSANDDGGSVIQGSELTGRWILIPPEVHLDVRHFGVFPYASQNNVENQRVGILNAVQYANQVGLRVWFPKTETNTGNNIEYKYYRYDNLYAVFGNGLDVDEGVIFLDSGTNSTFRFSDIHGDLYFQSANTAVLANYAKASWNMRALSKNNDLEPATYVIDTMEMSSGVRSLTKWTVKCTTDPVYGFTFSYCDIGEDEALGSVEIDGTYYNNEFWNCKLTGKMFITSGQYEASLVNLAHNCEFDLQDFRHCPGLWRQLRCTDDANPFIDWQDLQAPGKPYASYVGNKILSNTIMVSNLKNGLENRINIDAIGNQQTLILENCTGWYKISSQLNTTINNSDIKLTLQNAQIISAKNSTIYLDETNPMSAPVTLSFIDCTVIGADGVQYKFENFNGISSILYLSMKNRNTTLKDCQVNGDLQLLPREVEVGKVVTYNGAQVYVNHLASGFIDDCILNGNFTVDLAVAAEEFGATDALVDGLVIKDTRLNGNWYTYPRGCSISDRLNDYTFVNNTGNFESKISVDATARFNSGEGSPGTLVLLTAGQSKLSAYSLGTGNDVSDSNKYFTIMSLFSIGWTDFAADVAVQIDPNNVGAWSEVGFDIPSRITAHLTTLKLQSGSGVALPALEHYTGSLWKIRTLYIGDAPGMSDGTKLMLYIRQLDKR